jgi:tRNA(Ile)-lysidine synthetase-like protein
VNPNDSNTDEAEAEAQDRCGLSLESAVQTPVGFEQRVLHRARSAGFRRGDDLVVGFSGGPDSLALAAALRWPRQALGIEPHLVHVDHRLRAASAAEAQQAVALGRALGLEVRVVRLAASPTRRHPGVGMEEAARRERYRSLFTVADELGARAVVTAHHEQDQAETVLLHLLRGGGVHGAAGMGEHTRPPLPRDDISPEIDNRIWLWRPLLQESRAAIDDYVAHLGLEPVADPSNDDLTPRRNVVRHDILPRLQAQFPGAVAALSRYAVLAAEDDRVLHDLAARALAGAVVDGALPIARVRAQPVALQRRMTRLWLQEWARSVEVSANRIEAILELVRVGRGGRAVEIGEGWTVHTRRGMLRLERLESD